MSDGSQRQSVLAQDRSRKTYRGLLDTARRLWWERGFDEVSVSEICQEVGVAKGTFYFYFPKKEDLLIEIGLASLDPVHDRMIEELTTAASAHDVLVSTTKAIASVAAATPKHLLKRINEEAMGAINRFEQVRGDHATYGDIFRSIFGAAVERRELDGQYSSDELGMMLSWMLVQGEHFWASSADDMNLEQLLLRRAELLWAGAARAPTVHEPS